MRTAALAFVVLAASAPALAQAPGTGTFTSKDISFDIGGAVAFNGPSTMDKTEPAIIVAVSNGRLASTLGDYVDRRRAIDTLVKDDETAIVYLEFTPQGRYRGLSYYFGSGNGCGFCSSTVDSTVKLANGKLAGTLKGTEKDRPFTLTLDVAVMGDDHGAPLTDGGAPGKSFLAYHAALLKRDSAALRPTLTAARMQVWDRSKKNGELDDYLTYLAKKHQLKTVKITKGWARADVASLLVEGEGPDGALSGEVLLLREQGAWVVDSEVLIRPI